MYFLQMTRSMEHTEEEDNDEGGGREEITNEQLVKGTSLVYNTHFCAIHAQFMHCIRTWYDVRKYRDDQKKTLLCMYQDLGGY